MKESILRLKWLFSAIALLPATAFAEDTAIPDLAAGWDELWHELMIDISVIGVIFGTIALYFLIRYRRRRQDEEGKGPRLSKLASFGWVFVPAFLFIADDIFLAAKNFELWNKMRGVPEGAYEVKVQGFMWGFEITHPDGTTETNELRVPEGTAVKASLSSRDVVHSFFLPDYRVKWDMVPGMNTYLWFNSGKVGEHVMTCAEYCGTMHSGMHGKVIVMPKAEFDEWVKSNAQEKKS